MIVSFLHFLATIAFTGIVAPFVVSAVASEGIASNWLWAVALGAFIIAILLAYITILSFPASCAIFVAVLRGVVGDGDRESRESVAPMTPFLGGTGESTAAPVGYSSDISSRPYSATKALPGSDDFDRTPSSPAAPAAGPSVSRGPIGMYSKSAARRAFLVPSAPRRGLTFGQLCGSIVGLFMCCITLGFLVVVGTVFALIAVTFINCQEATTLVDEATYFFLPKDVASASAVVAAIGPGMLGEIRFTNDTSIIGNNATLAGSGGGMVGGSRRVDTNATSNGTAVPPGAVAIRLTASAFGGLDRFLSYFTPVVGAPVQLPPPPPVDTNHPTDHPLRRQATTPQSAAPGSVVASLGISASMTGTDFMQDSWSPSMMMKSVSRWLTCPTVRIIVALPPSAVPMLQATTLEASVEMGVITDAPIAANESLRGTINGFGNVSMNVEWGMVALHSLTVIPGSTSDVMVSWGSVSVKEIEFPPYNATNASVTLDGGYVNVQWGEGPFAGSLSVTADNGMVNVVSDDIPDRTWAISLSDPQHMIATASINGSAPHTFNVIASYGDANVDGI